MIIKWIELHNTTTEDLRVLWNTIVPNEVLWSIQRLDQVKGKQR